MTTTGNISGFAIFRHNGTGQEAVVPLETAHASGYLLPFDNTQGLATGLALANASDRTGKISVTARDDTGASLATATVELPPLGHNAFMVPSLLPAAANKRGTVEFESQAGSEISVLGLRATPGGALTTIPVFPK